MMEAFFIAGAMRAFCVPMLPLLALGGPWSLSDPTRGLREVEEAATRSLELSERRRSESEDKAAAALATLRHKEAKVRARDAVWLSPSRFSPSPVGIAC